MCGAYFYVLQPGNITLEIALNQARGVFLEFYIFTLPQTRSRGDDFFSERLVYPGGRLY